MPFWQTSIGVAFALVLLTACQPPPEPEVSRPLGTLQAAWDVAATASYSDSSSTLRLTPLIYADSDDLIGGYRYLTVTLRAENLSAAPLENATLRAVAPTPALGGTAVSEVEAFDGTDIADPSVAHSVLPIPQPGADTRDFQAFTPAESELLERAAKSANHLQPGEAVLDYGYVLQDRSLDPGETALVNVAVRIPRSFQGSPKPYRFKLSFLLTTSPTVRVSRALGETTAQALARAKTLGTPVQLVLVGPDDDTTAEPGVKVLRVGNLRTGTAPTYLLP